MIIPDGLVIDCDGVLADFNESFIDLVQSQTGVVLQPRSATYPDTWAYHLAAGVTPEQDRQLWEAIANSNSFWLALSPLPTAKEALSRLDKARVGAGMRWKEPIFMTCRKGVDVKLQTEKWLAMQGYSRAHVVVDCQKGKALSKLRASTIIDDKPENLFDVASHSPNTWRILIDAPYNKSAQDDGRIDDISSNILEALKELEVVE